MHRCAPITGYSHSLSGRSRARFAPPTKASAPAALKTPRGRHRSARLRCKKNVDNSAAPFAAVPTAEGRIDARALALLEDHPGFCPDFFVWVGSEHLGGGVFCASLYAGTEADSPYLWVTAAEGNPKRFSVCVYVGSADGGEAEEALLFAECGVEDLAAESLRMLGAAREA